MKGKNIAVKEVLNGSIAEEAGIEPGDILLRVNGREIKDVFDYRFLTADENLEVLIRKPNGEQWELEIEKDEYEDLGLEFEEPMMDEASSCTNKCIFCFIDQLPKGMRNTLYFKDDDSRLSFLSGNYVTLTNMKTAELDRIIRYRMSPINVSVHTTNPALRKQMLNNRFAGDVLDKVRRLVEGGIEVNCQIVLCRGVNDGGELDRTLKDLSAMVPGIKSISVVPVGITRHREGLHKLEPFEQSSAAAVLIQLDKWQEKFVKESGTRLVYPADEFFILSGRNIPGCEYYEDFPQIENGVGLISLFRQEFYERLSELTVGKNEAAFLSAKPMRVVSVATGVSPFTYIENMVTDLECAVTGAVKVNVYKIRNEFFGENVTVTGLLTGGDLVSQLKGRELGEDLLISRSMMRSGEELFLDDYTVKQVSQELGVNVVIVENDGAAFFNGIIGKI